MNDIWRVFPKLKEIWEKHGDVDIAVRIPGVPAGSLKSQFYRARSDLRGRNPDNEFVQFLNVCKASIVKEDGKEWLRIWSLDTKDAEVIDYLERTVQKIRLKTPRLVRKKEDSPGE